MLPQSTPDTTAAVVDTLTLGQRLRADTVWVERFTRPGETFESVRTYFSERFLDPALWIGLTGVVLKVAFLLFAAFLVIALVDKAARRWSQRFQDLPALHPRRQRVTTVTNLLVSVVRYVVWPIVLISVLGEIGIPVAGLLATAGIAGLAVGFGAQTLVRDVISGVFLLFDDSLHVGDLIRIGPDEGTVEFIGIRLIKVRKFNGELLMVPAGELRVFGNRSIGFARVVVNVGLSYEQPTGPILDVMQRVADEWTKGKESIMLEERAQVQAITDFTDSAVSARIVFQVLPGEQWQAERELRMMLKETFEREGIEIPFPRRTLYMRAEGEAEAPPSRASEPPSPS